MTRHSVVEETPDTTTSVSADQGGCSTWEELNLRPHPQVKIPGRGGKLPGTYQGRRGPRPSAEQSTTQGPSCAAHLHPVRVAAGHEPLTMEPPRTAVRTAVSPGHARPSGSKSWVLFRRSYAFGSAWIHCETSSRSAPSSHIGSPLAAAGRRVQKVRGVSTSNGLPTRANEQPQWRPRA